MDQTVSKGAISVCKGVHEVTLGSLGVRAGSPKLTKTADAAIPIPFRSHLCHEEIMKAIERLTSNTVHSSQYEQQWIRLRQHPSVFAQWIGKNSQ